jgi:hypothetical protein
MMCERAGEVTALTSSKYLPLGAIFRTYSKVRGYLLYPSKQLYNPQHPPPVSTFQLTRFMSILAPTWLTTIRPTLTYFVSKHHKCHTQRRIDGFFDKRSSIIVLFQNPLFYYFFIKQTILHPSGANTISETSEIVSHCSIGDFVAQYILHCSSLWYDSWACQVFWGRLRD